MSKPTRIFSLVAIAAGGIALIWWFGPRGPAPVQPAAVVQQYTQIGHAIFSDSLASARALQSAVQKFIQSPSQKTQAQARKAWLAARVPYLQSEVFRFSNPPVDEWEGQLNAWPLDEGLIDYVAPSYVYEQGNSAGQANIIANPVLQVGSRQVDSTEITPALLADLNEIGGSEANVASGYHAIEFLLWGQDLNGTSPGAGERPVSDYYTDERCTDGDKPAPAKHCKRRAQYLSAASQLLVDDLEYMVGVWAPDIADNYRAQFTNELPEDEALRRILFGMGSLALGELAGERMKVALIAHSTEDEHDCFSDNTHNSQYYDALGIANVYHGEYQRIDGSVVSGPGIDTLVAQADEQAAANVNSALNNALAKLNEIVQSAKNGEHFDQMIAPGNTAGNQKVQAAIDALVVVAQEIETASKLIGIDKLQPDAAGHNF